MAKINVMKKPTNVQYQCGGLRVKIVETAEELREVKWIRIKVFQKEQGVSMNVDFDGNDVFATHIVAYINEMPVGTTRIILSNNGAGKIQRMAVLKGFRNRGIGSQIIKYALDFLKNQRIKLVRLSSQEQVRKFYEQFGFRAIGDVFDEAKIRHIMMEKIL